MTRESNYLKEEIETRLACLIGQPLSWMQRYAGCQRFEIGHQFPAKNRKGEDITLSDYAIVVSCLWEIHGSEGNVVGRNDFGPGSLRRDSEARWFYEVVSSERLFVESIVAESNGGFTLELSEAYILIVTPDLPRKQRYSKKEKILREMLLRDGEIWRFMPKKQGNDDSPHFVVAADGWYGEDE